ncbi:MOSC N-terminal beta barrel domain-containing protein, partial [Streptomyces sp. T21Q-yed]
MGHAQLQSVHVHPVKAFRGTAPREAVVEPWGLAGDRRWVLIDDGGKVVTQRQQPRLALAAA